MEKVERGMRPDKEEMLNALKITIDTLIANLNDMRMDAERQMKSAEETADQRNIFFRFANVIMEISNTIDRAGMMYWGKKIP